MPMCAPIQKWFRKHTSEQYLHYGRFKAVSELAISRSERLYLIKTASLPDTHASDLISSAKKNLAFANQLRGAEKVLPADLISLMDIDLEFCNSSCSVFQDAFFGKTDWKTTELELARIQEHYTTYRSGYLNKGDLELLLGKSNVALNEAIEMLTHKAALSRGNDAIDRANEALDIDFKKSSR